MAEATEVSKRQTLAVELMGEEKQRYEKQFGGGLVRLDELRQTQAERERQGWSEYQGRAAKAINGSEELEKNARADISRTVGNRGAATVVHQRAQNQVDEGTRTAVERLLAEGITVNELTGQAATILNRLGTKSQYCAEWLRGSDTTAKQLREIIANLVHWSEQQSTGGIGGERLGRIRPWDEGEGKKTFKPIRADNERFWSAYQDGVSSLRGLVDEVVAKRLP